VVVLSPAPHGAVGEKRARVEPPRARGRRVRDACDSHWRGGAERGGRGVAELARVVAAPAFERAIWKARAGVEAATGNSSGPGDSGDCHGRRGVGRGPVAELARVVQPPAPQRSVVEARTGVEGAGFDGGGRADSSGCELLDL